MLQKQKKGWGGARGIAVLFL